MAEPKWKRRRIGTDRCGGVGAVPVPRTRVWGAGYGAGYYGMCPECSTTFKLDADGLLTEHKAGSRPAAE